MGDVLGKPGKVPQKFPMLKLPENPKMGVVRSMESEDQVTFSYCSNATRKLIKKLNVNTNLFMVNIGPPLSIDTSFNDASVTREVFLNSSPTPEADFNIHLKHLLSILNRSQINDLHFNWACESYNVVEFCRILSEIWVWNLYISADITNVIFLQILNSNIHPYRLMLEKNPFTDGDLIQKVLVRNYGEIHLYPTTSPKLDDLLVCNSASIHIYNSILTGRDLNKFLKAWRNGANPSLRYLSISVRGMLIEDVVMKGIKFERIPEETSRTFLNQREFKGGLDVKRADGTKGTVILDVSEVLSYFEFYVWG